MAYANAIQHAQKRGVDAACVLLRLKGRNYLDMQNPEIEPLFKAFRQMVANRIQQLGLRLERASDLYRPPAHFYVDIFCLCIEALSGDPVHVVKAQFPSTKEDGEDLVVEKLVTPELCIKHPDAIADKRTVTLAQDVATEFDPPEVWIPSNALVMAAQAATAFVRDLGNASFVDLICKVSEGAGHFWHRRKRFPAARAIPLVMSGETDVSGAVRRVWQSLTIPNRAKDQVFVTGSLSAEPGPGVSAVIDSLVDNASGIVRRCGGVGRRFDQPSPGSKGAEPTGSDSGRQRR